MPEVILDAEEVSFEGSKPKTVEDVFCLLNGHLEAKGRCFKEFKVDGVDILKGGADEVALKKFWVIEAISMGQGELYKDQVRALVEQYGNLGNEGAFLAGEVLREPWTHTVKVVSEWIERVVPMTQEIEALREFARGKELEWKRELDVLLLEHEACFTALLSAIEIGDVAVLSELLSEPLLALVNKTKYILEYWVLEYFKNWEVNHEFVTS